VILKIKNKKNSEHTTLALYSVPYHSQQVSHHFLGGLAFLIAQQNTQPIIFSIVLLTILAQLFPLVTM
jgi:hypothetical protein